MVAEGVTLTGVPLLVARSPGVITPAPLVKTPAKLADPLDVIVAGFAATLVVEGALGVAWYSMKTGGQ
jgi:hypothetical protein